MFFRRILLTGPVSLALAAASFLAFSGTPASAQATGEVKVAGLIASQNYDLAAAECKKAAASQDPAERMAAYGNMAKLVGKTKAVTLDEANKFYAEAPAEFIAADLQPMILMVSHLRVKNRDKDAAAILDAVKKASPENTFYKSTAPAVFIKAGRADEAMQMIEDGLKNSKSADFTKQMIFLKAEALVAMNKAKEAQELLAEEMKKFPDDPTFAEFFTSISMRKGDFSKSMDLVKAGMANGQKNEGTMRAMFTQAMASGNFDAALEHFQKMADENPGDIAVNTMVAELNVVAKKYDKAEKMIEKLLADLPQNTRAHLLKGRLMFDQGQYQNALDYFNKTVEQFGDSVENKTYYYLSLSCIKTGNIVDAIKFMEIELERSPANSKILMRELEDALYSEKMFNAAITIFKQLLEKRPVDADILTKLGLFYFYSGKYESALLCLGKANSLAPDSMTVNYILGVILSESKQPDKAKEFFKKCLAIQPGELAKNFKIDSEQSAVMIWPFAHNYFCYIHAALRLGEMEKVTKGLSELFEFLAKQSPPQFVVKDVEKVDPLTARFEYSVFRSFEFFAKNVLDRAFMTKIESADEPKAILDFFLKKQGVRELYNKSMDEQLAGNYEKAMSHILAALELDPENPFLIIRGTSLGVWTNSYKVIPVAGKMLTLAAPARDLSDEEKFIYAYAKSLQVGAQGNMRSALLDALDHYKKTGAPKYDPRVIAEFEKVYTAVKDTKFKKLNMMLSSTLYFYKGNITSSKQAVVDYIKADPDLSTMVWFLHNIGSFVLPYER